ncbi:MAG: PEP-utilizing enzyme [Candidatus Micrarchaeota archaeon]
MLTPDGVKKREWHCWYSRKVSLQKAYSFCRGLAESCEKQFGYTYDDNAVVFDGVMAEGLTPVEDIRVAEKKIGEQLDDPAFTRAFYPRAYDCFDRVLSLVLSFEKTGLARLSNSELGVLYEKFLDDDFEWTAFGWYGLSAEAQVSAKAKAILESKGAGELFDAVLSPSRQTYPFREKKDFLELALKAKSASKQGLDALLEKHAGKWSFLSTYDFDHEPLGAKDFALKLKETNDPAKDLEEMDYARRQSEEKTNKALALPLTGEEKEFLSFAKEFAFFKEYRNEIRYQVGLKARLLYEEIGRRLGLGLKEVLFMTNEEIIGCLEQNVKPQREEIEARKVFYVVLQDGKKFVVLTGPKAREYASVFFKKEETAVLKGVAASPGQASGKAKIINSVHDLSKLEEGDVLIATMTRPEYLMGMKKAVAIVTNEGGLLSHAAIVSRELKIPCIVGTKTATKIFKDGDLVEVDATQGVIKNM